MQLTGMLKCLRFSALKEVHTTGVEAKNRAHVSGQIDIDSLMYAHSSYTNRTWIDGAFDDNGDFVEEEEEATSAIRMNDDGIMSYHPAAMTVGVRYYAAHPIGFNSHDQRQYLDQKTATASIPSTVGSMMLADWTCCEALNRMRSQLQ